VNNFINGDKFLVCQYDLKLRDKTTIAQQPHHSNPRRQDVTLRSEENYLVACLDIIGIVYHAHLSMEQTANQYSHRDIREHLREKVC
jgi:hypothetical protein